MHHWFKSNESCMRNGEAACSLQYILRLIFRASVGGLSADSYCSTLQKTSHLMYVLMVLSRWRKLLSSSSHFGRHCCHKQARDFQARIKTVIWHVWYRLDGRHKRMCVCVLHQKQNAQTTVHFLISATNGQALFWYAILSKSPPYLWLFTLR